MKKKTTKTKTFPNEIPRKIAIKLEVHSWSIHRDEKQVIFGCGAVKFNKNDLRALKEALPAIKRYMQKAENTFRVPAFYKLITLTPNELGQIIGE